MWYSQLFEKKYRNLETCFCRWELFFYYCRLISRPDDGKLRWFAGCRDKHFQVLQWCYGIHRCWRYLCYLFLYLYISTPSFHFMIHWVSCFVHALILSNSTSRVSKGVHGRICSWLSQGLLLSTNNINLWYYYKATCSYWQWKSRGRHDCFSCKRFLWIWLNLDVLCL